MPGKLFLASICHENSIILDHFATPQRSFLESRYRYDPFRARASPSWTLARKSTIHRERTRKADDSNILMLRLIGDAMTHKPHAHAHARTVSAPSLSEMKDGGEGQGKKDDDSTMGKSILKAVKQNAANAVLKHTKSAKSLRG